MSGKNSTTGTDKAVSRRDFLKAAGAGAVTLAFAAQLGPLVAAPKRKPNIVLIVADDLGYGELGAQGNKEIPTPNIDSIARNGVRFTNGYVTCPVCSPTRAGLMTGRYQQRFGHEFNPAPPKTKQPHFGLSLSEKTMAERLKPLGYATGMFGKWHLGYEPQFHPLKRGFDEFWGFLGGRHDYLRQFERDEGNPMFKGTTQVPTFDYTTDSFAREAVSFIERHRNEPFFVYLPFNAVHEPLEAPDKYIERFRHIADEKRRKYAAMQSALDDNVGKVLTRLRDLKLEDNTLVFFISDNGGPTGQTTSSNLPLRGAKGQVFEGGIRVPFVVQWKGQIPAGKLVNDPVFSLDIHATALAAAGGKATPDMKLDGVDLVPFLAGKTGTIPHDRLFWRFGDQWAVRMGDWKLETNGNHPPELYNLKDDIGETTDLAARNPEKVKALRGAYDKWNAQLAKPKWGRGGAAVDKPLMPQPAGALK